MAELKILGIGILSWMVFLPVLGMIVILAIPKSRTDLVKYIAVAFTLLVVVFAVVSLVYYNPNAAGVNNWDTFQYKEKATWIDVDFPAQMIGKIHIEYMLGVDGISFPMILLTALIGFVGALASFSVKKNEKGYYAMYLFLLTGMMGTFVALDMFLFFLFWEIYKFNIV